MLTVADLKQALTGVPDDLPVSVHVEPMQESRSSEVDEWADAYRAERSSVPGEGPAFVIFM